MLERLSVRGLGIISAVELDLDGGFTVLTGETGAGKSLLVESLKLLGGQRAQSDMVRTGDDRLQVEGIFTVEADSPLPAIVDDLGVTLADHIVLRREVTEGGRGRAWINDVAVTAGSLQKVAPYLLAIHGQHEQHGLADDDVQRQLVDDFGSHDDLVEETATRFASWREAADELERLRTQQATRRDRLDTISFQLQEIDGVGPAEGEDDELRHRRNVLRHATPSPNVVWSWKEEATASRKLGSMSRRWCAKFRPSAMTRTPTPGNWRPQNRDFTRSNS